MTRLVILNAIAPIMTSLQWIIPSYIKELDISACAKISLLQPACKATTMWICRTSFVMINTGISIWKSEVPKTTPQMLEKFDHMNIFEIIDTGDQNKFRNFSRRQTANLHNQEEGYERAVWEIMAMWWVCDTDQLGTGCFDRIRQIVIGVFWCI